jgi:hypothetical protein
MSLRDKSIEELEEIEEELNEQEHGYSNFSMKRILQRTLRQIEL